MVGWHHWLDGPEFEQALRVGDGQGSLAWWWTRKPPAVQGVAKSQTWLNDWPTPPTRKLYEIQISICRDKVLFNPSHAHTFTHYIWLLLCYNDRHCDRDPVTHPTWSIYCLGEQWVNSRCLPNSVRYLFLWSFMEWVRFLGNMANPKDHIHWDKRMRDMMISLF